MRTLHNINEGIIKVQDQQHGDAMIPPVNDPIDELSKRILNNFRKTVKCRLRTSY